MKLSGSNLAFHTKNITFTGFNQNVKVDSAGEVKANYVVLDTDRGGSQLFQTYVVNTVSGKLQWAGRSISFPGGSPPPSDSRCWFDKNTICTGGRCTCIPELSVKCFFPTCFLIFSSGVEVTYIIVVLAVIASLAVGGLTLSLYVRYVCHFTSCD